MQSDTSELFDKYWNRDDLEELLLQEDEDACMALSERASLERLIDIGVFGPDILQSRRAMKVLLSSGSEFSSRIRENADLISAAIERFLDSELSHTHGPGCIGALISNFLTDDIFVSVANWPSRLASKLASRVSSLGVRMILEELLCGLYDDVVTLGVADELIAAVAKQVRHINARLVLVSWLRFGTLPAHDISCVVEALVNFATESQDVQVMQVLAQILKACPLQDFVGLLTRNQDRLPRCAEYYEVFRDPVGAFKDWVEKPNSRLVFVLVKLLSHMSPEALYEFAEVTGAAKVLLSSDSPDALLLGAELDRLSELHEDSRWKGRFEEFWQVTEADEFFAEAPQRVATQPSIEFPPFRRVIISSADFEALFRHPDTEAEDARESNLVDDDSTSSDDEEAAQPQLSVDDLLESAFRDSPMSSSMPVSIL